MGSMAPGGPALHQHHRSILIGWSASVLTDPSSPSGSTAGCRSFTTDAITLSPYSPMCLQHVTCHMDMAMYVCVCVSVCVCVGVCVCRCVCVGGLVVYNLPVA